MTAIRTGLATEISVSSQLETVLQKMLVINRTLATNPLRKCSKPCSPTPLHRCQTPTSPNAYRQLCRTKPVPNLATATKREVLKSLRHTLLIWAGFALGVRVAGAGMIVLIGTNAWGLNSVIRSIQLLPVGQRSPSTSHSSSENTRADKIRDRLKALKLTKPPLTWMSYFMLNIQI